MSEQNRIEIVMPQMGISVAEATLIGWLKALGEPVKMDEPICEISSDKVDSDVPAPTAGALVELLIEVGQTVDVGTPIAIFEAAGAGGAPATGSPSAAAATAAADSAQAEPASAEEASAGRVSPVVERLAAEHGVDLATVTGTGAGGRVRKEDVLAAAAAASAEGARAGEQESPQDEGPATGRYVPPPTEPMSRMRQSIGEHMLRSLRTAAMVTQWIEVDFEALQARRRALGVTALPIVAAATAATLGEFPDLNAWLDGEDYTRHTDVNLGIAVSLGDEGLIVPVIRAAQTLEVTALAAAISDVATRARAHELTPDEVHDGTFTITNPGQFGTLMATPVIAQPQVAILDVEAITRRPVVIDDGSGAETIAIHSICILGMSWDHRALDGAYAARFLASLRDRLQAPLEG
jgi:pyruvate/2-oxoglutarate dehydrogenase complex dihydrolipoamide acyltransferase (E2) component